MIESMERRRLLSGAASQLQLVGDDPAVFVQNLGQFPSTSVKFAYQGGGAAVAMTDTGALFRIDQTDIDPIHHPDLSSADDLSTAFAVHFDGARRVNPVGTDQSSTLFNYLVGDQSSWRTNVPGFETIVYPKLYRGIDLAISGAGKSLKYEFRVAPGADYRTIKLSYSGTNGLSIDATGRLHISTDLGDVIDDAPVVYQMINGRKVTVASRYQLVDGDTYQFRITGKYDRRRALIIDPKLDWSTYLGGGNDDVPLAVAVDSNGNAWQTGWSTSADWTGGGFDTSLAGTRDAFVSKINPDGSLAWSSYLGGSNVDFGLGIATDNAGGAWVTGYTGSSDFATGDGFDTSFNGSDDAFVARIDSNGALLWSSYLGGSSVDYGYGIACDTGGNAWITGWTSSTEWTAGGFDTSLGGVFDAFVAKINAGGTLAWSSYLGGTLRDYGNSIAMDHQGNAWISGHTQSTDFGTDGFDTSFNGGTFDAFAAKVNADGTFAWSSYLGGGDSDIAFNIATDPFGNAFVSGETASSGWAIGGYDTNYGGGGNDAFVAKINGNGALAWSSYLGGEGYDDSQGIATDITGNVWITGQTASLGWVSGGFDTSLGGIDAYVTKLNPNGTLSWSSYLGSTAVDRGFGIAIAPSQDAWVVGQTSSTDFANGGFDTSFNGGTYDGFIAKISEAPSVFAAQFVYDAQQQCKLQFNRPISETSAFSTIVLQNLTTSQFIDSSLLNVTQANNGATVMWTYTSGILSDGNYRLILPAGSMLDLDAIPMANTFNFDFHVLGGDANRDRKVDINDLAIFANNWQGAGKVFSQGDFNYDGVVDALDLGILSANWQFIQAPQAPAAPISLPTRAPTRSAGRIVSVVL